MFTGLNATFGQKCVGIRCTIKKIKQNIVGILLLICRTPLVACCWDEYTPYKYSKTNCNLTEVPSIYPGTREINLTDNMIGYIPFWAFYRLSYCMELWLQSNRLTYIQAWTFKGLSFLDQLVLSDNAITEIEAGAFSHLPRCQCIWLNANELTHIRADMFKGLHFLKTISFHDNRLNSIGADVFQGIPSLQVISLNRNNISYIQPETFANLRQLRMLGLHTNRLTTLEKNIFNEIRPQNLTLIIDDNALWCDARMCWMGDAERDGWIKFNHSRGEFVWGKPKCVNYPGVDWDDLTLNCTESGV